MTEKSNIDLETSLIARIIQTIDPDAAAILSENGDKILVSHGMGEDEGEPKWNIVERVVESGGPSSETNLEHSILAVPYKDGQGKTKGIMYIELQAPRKIRHRDLAILQELRRRAEKIYSHFVESSNSEEGLERLSKARRSAVSTLNVITRILKPERGAIFVQIGGEPRALAAHGIQNDSLEAASISAPLLEHLWKSDGPQLIVDAKNELDPGQFEDVVDYRIRSVASCPLQGADGVTRGLIYLDHREDADYFQGPQLAILKRFAETFKSDISWLLDGGPGQGLGSSQAEIDSPSAWLSEETTPKAPVARKTSPLPPFARRKRRAEVTSAPPQVPVEEEDDPGALFPEPTTETTELAEASEEYEAAHESDVITIDFPDDEPDSESLEQDGDGFDQASEPTMEDEISAIPEEIEEEELRRVPPDATIELTPDKADALRRLIQEGSDFEDSEPPLFQEEPALEPSVEVEEADLFESDSLVDQEDEESAEEELVELLLIRGDEVEEERREPSEEEESGGLRLVRQPLQEVDEPVAELESEEEVLDLLEAYEEETDSDSDGSEIELLDESGEGDDIVGSDSIIDRDELEIEQPAESGELAETDDSAPESVEEEETEEREAVDPQEPDSESLQQEDVASESLEQDGSEDSESDEESVELEELEEVEESEEPASESLDQEDVASESLEQDESEDIEDSENDEESVELEELGEAEEPEESATESLEQDESEDIEDSENDEESVELEELGEAEEPEESASESLEEEDDASESLEQDESDSESLEEENAEEPNSESPDEESTEESASENSEEEDAEEVAVESSEEEDAEEAASENSEEEDAEEVAVESSEEEDAEEPDSESSEQEEPDSDSLEQEEPEPIGPLGDDFLTGLEEDKLEFLRVQPHNFEESVPVEYDASESLEQDEPEAESESEPETESSADDEESETPEETVEYFEPPVTEFPASEGLQQEEPAHTLELSADKVLGVTAAVAAASTAATASGDAEEDSEVSTTDEAVASQSEPVEESLEAPPTTSSYPQSAESTALATTASHVITASEPDVPEATFWQKLWAKVWPWAKTATPNKRNLQGLSISGNIYFDKAPSDQAPTEITIIFPAKKMKVVLELQPDETSYDCHLRFEDEIPPRFSLAIQRAGYFPVKFSSVNVMEDEDDGFHAMVSEITLIPRDH